MSSVAQGGVVGTASLRVRILEHLEGGPRTERALVALTASSTEIVRGELQSMGKEGIVTQEVVVLPVWRITAYGLRSLR